MRELRQALDILLAIVESLWWTTETLWLGARAIMRSVILCTRYRAIVAEVRPCARGHEVAMYGLFECHCGSRVEGWVFARCAVCGESAGWTACVVCGLPVRNPLLP